MLKGAAISPDFGFVVDHWVLIVIDDRVDLLAQNGERKHAKNDTFDD